MRANDPKSESLLPRLIASIVASVTVISLAFAMPMIAATGERMKRDLSESAKLTADKLAGSLSIPVWNLATAEIETQLRMSLSDENAYSASISFWDIDMPSITVSRPPEGDIPRRSLIEERREIIYQGRRLADLELVFTRAIMERRLMSDMARQALLIGALDGALLVVLLFLLRFFIILPLRRIEHWAAAVSTGNPPPLRPGKARGEIASLRDSISRMVRLLGDRYDAMVAREREYRSLFESSPVATWELDCSAIRSELGTSGRAKSRHLSLIRVRGANAAALRPLGLSSPPRGLPDIIGGSLEAVDLFERELESLREGLPGAFGDVSFDRPGGGRRTYTIRFAVLAGHEEDWSRVIATAEDITDRVAAEDGLKRSLAEKETLVQELFHRTHNSLQLMDSIISLRSAKSRDLSSAGEMRALGLRVRAMAMAQDQLTRSGDLSQIDLGDYLRDLLSMIAAEAPGPVNRVKAMIAARPVTTLIDAAVPIGLIAVELGSNSIVHAFPDERVGVISALLERKADGSVSLSIGDDGVGPPESFDPRADASLGLQTVIALAEKQLRGSVEFDFSKGFRCAIRFDDRIFERRV